MCVCVCQVVDLVGQTDEDCLKKWVMPNSRGGEERAGAPPYRQHLPLLVSPSSIPIHLTPLPLTPPSFINTSRARVL